MPVSPIALGVIASSIHKSSGPPPPPGAKRYHAIQMASRSTAPLNFTASEIIFAETLGGPNVAIGTGSYSAFENNGNAGNAFDGSNLTKWTSRTAAISSWIMWDTGVGNEVEIVEFGYRAPSSASRTPDELQYAVSDDGINWTVVARYTGLSWASSEEKRFSLTNVPPRQDFGSHRYWGVRAKAVPSGDYFECANLYLREDPFGPDATASGGTAGADSQLSATYSADKAFDNSVSTRYSSAQLQAIDGKLWWDFGAGNEKSINQIGWQAGMSGTANNPTEFEVIYSDNGIDWTTAATVTTPRDWGFMIYRFFDFFV